MTEVLVDQAIVRVYVQVEGEGYSAGMTADGVLHLERRGEVVDTGRFNGRHIVGISGEVPLPAAAYMALEQGLQGAAALVQWLVGPTARPPSAVAPELAR
ncbi:hypothetical protein WME90_01785 [Sorangium sp. So ce375]|uniref:hypothetical protein n=1 Tax=Sorangium sp. So ce375 TaxID=3133306 RepID=UPI003F5BC5DD